MAELKDIIAYILKKYPTRSDMSNARLTKLVYLSDWKHSIKLYSQISNIKWYFNNFGPFVWDVKDTARDNPHLFELETTTNMYGDLKTIFILRKIEYIPNLSDDEMESIDHVINETKNLSWDQFIRLVYSTYPIASTERYTYINLIEKAKEYMRR
ncbi:MAG: hypothetical protein METHAR1v1_1370003 [Methanothrix sp.]|jgi:hypothetical protein|nr:MAG: hypothetical protein METHAR1v1_1370003 [Methanothrix sp.]